MGSSDGMGGSENNGKARKKKTKRKTPRGESGERAPRRKNRSAKKKSLLDTDGTGAETPATDGTGAETPSFMLRQAPEDGLGAKANGSERGILKNNGPGPRAVSEPSQDSPEGHKRTVFAADGPRSRRGKPRINRVDYGRPEPEGDTFEDALADSLTLTQRTLHASYDDNGGNRPSLTFDDAEPGRQPARRRTSDSFAPESIMKNPSFGKRSVGNSAPARLRGSRGSRDSNSSDQSARLRRSNGSLEERKRLMPSPKERRGIQRRTTMAAGSLPPKAQQGSSRVSNLNMMPQRRSSILRRVKSMAGFKDRYHQSRRTAMASEDQTYVPPKSREASIFVALSHTLRGSMVDLTLWTYSASFAKVMLFFLVFYAVNILFWALVLDATDLATGGLCIHEDAENLGRAERYEFNVELAWATFTTVGYGTISPLGDRTGCYAVRFMCAFVAFVGVLFASQTAAIMYSKLMRILARASVTFSSTLCVQYGKGNEGSTVRFGQLNFRASVAPAASVSSMSGGGFSAHDLLNDDEPEGNTEDGFPVIEFRMINDRANHKGNEIWDAQIRGIVQLQKETSAKDVPASSSYRLDKATGGGDSTLDLEKKVYYPISLSPDSHPHFSRIWYVRHVLNAESPLLKREVRDMIAKDDGRWDKDFNEWAEIRDCLNEFISLRITLSGTSAVSASTVYGEHIYQFDDVCVGWRFANMVYQQKERVYKSWWHRIFKNEEKNFADERDEKNNIDVGDSLTKIDEALIHDIVPQPGGDHEPLNETHGSMFNLGLGFGSKRSLGGDR